MDLPYKTEYAKSSRAKCRGCKNTIEKDDLRLAVMVQSPMYDGKTPNWYHEDCFFKKQRPKTTDDIEGFETLRYKDQEGIKNKIENASAAVIPEKKGKKRSAKAANGGGGGALNDFNIEYSKSGRATCRGCLLKIMKDDIRISKKDFESEVGKKYGGQDMWHHLTCFANVRNTLAFFACGDMLPGFGTLKKEDQAEVKKQIPAIKQEDVPEIKKAKTDEVDGIDPIDAEIKKQNDIMYKYRDNLKKHLNKKEMQLLLEENEQEIPPGEDRMLDRLADIMTFGRLLPCKECKHGQFVFGKMGYTCHGDLTEWSKCNTVTKTPGRAKFTVPSELSQEYSFLKKYKYVPRVRAIKDVNPTNIKKDKDDPDEGKPRVEREKPRLYDMQFVIEGKLSRDKDTLKKEITSMGGKIVTRVNENVMAVISTKDKLDNMGTKICDARSLDIQVVTEDFLDEAKNSKTPIPELVVNKNICDWGGDPTQRLPPEPSTSHKSAKSKSIYTSKVPSKVTLKVKGGTAVDPDSGLEDRAHVYQDNGDKYTVVLGITDLQKQKNSFYKLQLLQSDKGNRYWVFRAWGRIGTTIGGNKLEDMGTLHDAKRHFEALYEEKSGNCWDMRDHFMKVPGRMYPIDLDYGEDESKLELQDDIPSKLPSEVQSLIKLIFDINMMKKVMMEFELDTEKMPLGKLSKSQMKKAYEVLTEVQGLIKNNGSKARLIDASNRFYTFIPHSAGVDDLPILDNDEIIKQKIEMIDNLMELEIAYSLLKSSSNSGVDSHYEQLNTEIDILKKDSEEFKIIKEYVQNTHAPTHSMFGLGIKNVFTINRKGEEKRFKPFKKMHNRKLLWHGSRVTNFAGILSQGLRIAPPEAPVTGYMFGKGIYFADCVSKSANYCCTSRSNNTGLLLLCDVALGEMYERKNADYIEKLPKGKNSCKGVGMSHPNPDIVKKIGDVEVPVGKLTQNTGNSSLLYNEYIVYDVAQVNVKYLIEMDFKYKY